MSVLTSTAGQADLPRWFGPTLALLGKMRCGTVDLALPDGRVFRASGEEPGDEVRIDVRNTGLFSRLMRDGQLAFSESYMDGWWDTPDLQATLDLLLVSNDRFGPAMRGAALVRAYERLRHWLRSNSKTQARKNIAYHYDLGNDFYSLWLDETMTYSSALYHTGQETLAQAQTAKYEAICESLGLKQGDSVLEIGCGWGGFAEHAARTRGVHVTGLTISREQHDFARARMQKAGLNERVEIVMRDYRDERGKYDGIASIEMFEAVGEKYWPVYFDTVRDRLSTGGKATLQIITIADHMFEHYRRNVDFIQKYIFPGGMLPSPTALARETARAGLRRTGSIEFGKSYSRTLREWHKLFNGRWDEVSQHGFDDRFRRMWNFYLASCASSFEAGNIDVTQLTLARA